MENTEKMAAATAKLRILAIICDPVDGWAKEVLGLGEPSAHGDIDTLYRGETFKELDSELRYIMRSKRFR